jgi:hypothetical protein
LQIDTTPQAGHNTALKWQAAAAAATAPAPAPAPALDNTMRGGVWPVNHEYFSTPKGYRVQGQETVATGKLKTTVGPRARRAVEAG